jgi:glycosyltransferase involved in cell wall biosynthesis
MHIAFLTSEYPTLRKPEGGLGNYIRKVSLELIHRGHCVTVFVLASKQSEEIDHGIQLHFIPRTKFHWRFHEHKSLHPWLDLIEQIINARRINRYVLEKNSQERIDIFQTSNYKALGIYLCNNRQFPIVCRCSSYQPLLRSANGCLRSLPEAIADWLEAGQLIEADATFSPSELIARTYERFEAVRPVVIRTPVDLSQLKTAPSVYLKIGEGKKYLLYFGALNGVKGVDLLIQAIPGILGANKDLSFIFIGRNDYLPGGIKAFDSLQTNLREYVDQQRIIYLTSLPKTQLYPIIEHSLGVVLPSRVDNYPNACLEALSLGVPVVGTYDSSLDEIIEDGKTGFLAKNGNPTSLEEVIDRLLIQSPMERAEMIENIHRKIDEISKEDRVGELLQFFHNVIDEYRK